MDGTDALGMGMGVVAVVVTNIALLIQKHSSNVERGKPLYKRWRFWIGFVVNAAAEIGLSGPASLFAPLVLLAPLGGVGVVVNALLARFGCVCGIKEALSFTEWFATFSIMCGVILVAVSGPGGHSEVVLDELPALFSQPIFLAFIIPAFLFIFWTLFLFPPCTCAQTEFALRIRPKEGSIKRTIISGSSAGCCGAVSVLSLKITAKTIVEFFGGHIPYPPPLSIICFVVLAVCAPLQLYVLNLSLSCGRATFCIPLYLSLTMLFMSFLGGILFNEFVTLMRDPYPLYLILYIAGCSMIMFGLALLSFKQQFRDVRSVAPESGPSRPSQISLVKQPSCDSTDGAAAEPPSAEALSGSAVNASSLTAAGQSSGPAGASVAPAATTYAVAHPRPTASGTVEVPASQLGVNGYLCKGGLDHIASTPWAGVSGSEPSLASRLNLRPSSPYSPKAGSAASTPISLSPSTSGDWSSYQMPSMPEPSSSRGNEREALTIPEEVIEQIRRVQSLYVPDRAAEPRLRRTLDAAPRGEEK